MRPLAPAGLLNLVDEMSIGLVAVDGQWLITYANAEVERINGVTRASLVGRPYWEAFPTVLGTDFEHNLRRAMAERVRICSECFCEPYQSWFEMDVQPLDDGGLAVYGRDISERKRAEAELRENRKRFESCFELGLVGMAITSPSKGCLDVNDKLCQILGYDREELMVKNWAELTHPDDLATNVAHYERAVAGEIDAYSLDKRFIRKNGEVVSTTISVKCLRSSDGSIDYFVAMVQDITDRVRADRVQRERDDLLARLQLQIAAMPIACILVDPANDLIDWNPAAERIFGYRRDEVLGKNALRLLVSPATRPYVRNMMRQFAAGDVITKAVNENITKDGRTILCQWHGSPLKNAEGEAIGFLAMAQDITEHKQAEEALRDSEERFRRTFECNMVPMGVWTLAGGITEANDALLAMIGYDREDLAAGRINWVRLTPPEYLYLDERSLAEIRRRGVCSSFEKEYIHKDGHRVPVLIAGAAFTGTADSGVFCAVDLTERNQAKRQLERELADRELLAEISTRLVPEGDVDELLRDIMSAAIAVTDADMGAMQLLDRSEMRLIASQGFERESIALFDHARVGGSALTGRRELVRDVEESRLGGVRALQSTPLISRSGRPVGTMSTYWRRPHEPSEHELRLVDLLARQAADLIERHHIQIEREKLLESEREARAEIGRAARLKDDFLATLSHELRTPLNAILGWTNLLKMGIADPDRVMHGVEVIERNARAQAQLINDLLDLSRIITGKMRLNVQRVDLLGIIDAAVQAVRPAAEARAVHLESTFEPLDEPVYGDGARLQQIMWNLLSNAVKFTPEGGHVQIVLARVNSQVEISVSDTGRGIRADFLPYVFQRFRQADASAAREHGGLGIGLALVKQLTELHGGEVRVSSLGEGLGSTFGVTLPLASLHPKDQPPGAHPRGQASMAMPGEANAPELAGLRVLVVDDEIDALEVIQRILEDRHAQVCTTRNAEDALMALAREKFDILLSDIGMPKRDGYDFISEVRKRGLRTPAAAVTAFARSEDRTRALLAGYQAHVTKPVEPSELLATVASLSGRLGSRGHH